MIVTFRSLVISSPFSSTSNWHLAGNAVSCATYCTLVQESVVELHKLLLGLFGTEVPEEVSMEVNQLREERQTRDQ